MDVSALIAQVNEQLLFSRHSGCVRATGTLDSDVVTCGIPVDMTGRYRRKLVAKRPDATNIGPCCGYRLTPLTKGCEMNHITMHGGLTVNGRTVIVHVGDGEACATVDGMHFNVRSLWQLYQLLRLLV